MLEELEKRNLTHCWWGTHYYSHCENKLEVPKKFKKEIEMPYDLAISLLGTGLAHSIPYHRNICTCLLLLYYYSKKTEPAEMPITR